MTIFKVVYDLTTPSNKVISYPTASDYAFGIKVTKAGVAQDGTITVKVGEETLTPEATQVDGFTIYNRTSSATPGAVKVDVTYAKDGITQKFTLVEVIEDKSTFEKGSGSSGGGAWGSITGDLSAQTDLTAYIGEEVGDGVQTAKDYTDEKVAPCLTAETDAVFQAYRSSNLSGNVSIGDSATYTGSGNHVAIGASSRAEDNNSIAIGKQAKTTGDQCIAIGVESAPCCTEGVAIGYLSKIGQVGYYKSQATALGSRTNCTGNNSTAVGYSSNASNWCTSVGAVSQAIGSGSIAVGYGTVSNANRSIAVGYNADSKAEDAIQLGTGTNDSTGTLQVWNFPLMNKSLGTLEAQRLGTGWSATGTLVLKSVNGNVQWVSE